MIKVMEGLKTLRRYDDGQETLAHFYAKGHSLLSNQSVTVYYQGDGPDTYEPLGFYINGELHD